MKIKNVTYHIDDKTHHILWQWQENGEEMFFVETLLEKPPQKEELLLCSTS